MKYKSVLALAIMTALLCSSFAAMAVYSPDNGNNSMAQPAIPSFAVGSIVILPNGTVSGSQAANVSHVLGSNSYTLLTNLIGNITILKTGAVFNANNFTISNSSVNYYGYVVNISNANNVSFLNANIMSIETALSFYNTSNDIASELTILTNTSGIELGASTSYINVSNSLIADNLLIPAFSAILIGYGPGAPVPLGSSYNSFYNLTVLDNISAVSGTPAPAVAIGSSYTNFENSFITVTGQSGYALGVVANHTLVKNNNLLLMQNGIGIVEGLIGTFYTSLYPSSYYNTISGNTITAENTSASGIWSTSDAGIISNSQGVISNNTINANYSSVYAGISMLTPNTIASNNTIVINSPISAGIVIYNSSISVTGNTVSTNGSFGTEDVLGQYNGYHLSNMTIENNVFLANSSGAVGAFGIMFPNYMSSNSVITSNIVNVNGTGSTGIYLTGNDTSITSNQISASSSTSSSSFRTYGIFSGQNNVAHNMNISGNTLFANALNYTSLLTVLDVNQSTISGNLVQQNLTYGQNSSLLTLLGVNETSVYGNTFSSPVNYSSNGLVMGYSQNDTFYNNEFSGASLLFNFTNANNSLFYHNNFMRYNSYGNSTNSTGNKFNKAYPVGGNYWGSSVSLIDTHSGPGQNLSGSDGIGDSPVTTVAGTDNYPLMYQWNSPTVTFKVNGLPANDTWTFVFNGATYTTSSQSMSINIVNGTYQNYSFTGEGTSLYYVQNENGSFAYNGSSASFTFDYVHWAYLNGSVNPSIYKLYLNGNLTVYNATSFNITIKAGTYELEIVAPGYSPYYENFTVSANQTQQVHVNFTTPPSSTGGFPTQYLYYIAGGVGAVIVAAGVAFALRKKNVGK